MDYCRKTGFWNLATGLRNSGAHFRSFAGRELVPDTVRYRVQGGPKVCIDLIVGSAPGPSWSQEVGSGLLLANSFYRLQDHSFLVSGACHLLGEPGLETFGISWHKVLVPAHWWLDLGLDPLMARAIPRSMSRWLGSRPVLGSLSADRWGCVSLPS